MPHPLPQNYHQMVANVVYKKAATMKNLSFKHPQDVILKAENVCAERWMHAQDPSHGVSNTHYFYWRHKLVVVLATNLSIYKEMGVKKDHAWVKMKSAWLMALVKVPSMASIVV